MSLTFQPAGDLAVLVELDGPIGDALATRLRALEQLITERIPAVRETVPAFRSLLVYYDPLATGYAALCESIAGLDARAATAEFSPPEFRSARLWIRARRNSGFTPKPASSSTPISPDWKKCE